MTTRRTPDVGAVVLVEGISDRAAVEAVAGRRGRDLVAAGVQVVPIGGAHAIANALARYDGVRVAGLCDAGEVREYARGLARAGLGTGGGREEMERLGFFVCDPDLEAELVRAVGADAVLAVIERAGELAAFRTFQKQPAKRELPLAAQLHAFMWNRKLRYARLLVDAVDEARIPRPLDAVLEHVLR